MPGNAPHHTDRELGDVPGHEFHGNQWTGGSGLQTSHASSASFAQDRLELAHDALAPHVGSKFISQDKKDKKLPDSPQNSEASSVAFAKDRIDLAVRSMVRMEELKPGSAKEAGKHVNAAKAALKKGDLKSAASSLKEASSALKKHADGRSLELNDRVDEALEDSPRDFELRGAIGIPQFQQFEGREHIVVPVVALVEGVIFASNATAPEFVPQSTIQRMAESFNGRKVTVGHPVRWSKSVSANSPDIFEQQAIGTVFNARAEGKRLLCEAWIDVEKVKKIDPTLYDSLAAGRTEEVSVGVQVAAAAEAGTHNGKKYQMVWKSASGDHLAFLPGAKGACSVEMGCGTHRMAMRHCVEGDTIEFDYAAMTAQLRALMPRGWGDDEVKQDITKALELIEPAVRNGSVLRIKNDTVTYVIYPPPSSYNAVSNTFTPWPMPEATYWQRSYTFNTDTQKFEIGSERTQVEPTTVYVPIRAAVANPLDRVGYEGGRWIVRSLDKKTKLGDHATRALAEEHARAIDAVLARLSVAKKRCTCATTAKHETGHECGCHKE